MEEESGALRSVIDILEHGVEVENGSVGIQVAVVLGGNTSIVEDAVVVAPSRLREIDGLGDVLVNEELGEKTKRAGTGNGLKDGKREMKCTWQTAILFCLRALQSFPNTNSEAALLKGVYPSRAEYS